MTRNDRFALWLSAGVVTAGMSMAMMAAAGSAVADDGATAGAGQESALESSDSTGKKPDSDQDGSQPGQKNDDKDKPETAEPSTGAAGKDTDGASEAVDTDEGPKAEVPSEPSSTADDPPAREAKKDNDHDEADPSTHESGDRLDKSGTDSPKSEVNKDEATDTKDVDAKDADAPTQTEDSAEPVADSAEPVEEAVSAAKSKQTAVDTALAFAAVEPAVAPTGPTLINVIGTIFFSIFKAVEDLIAGPPAVPPGSNVRVSRAPLEIDCGPGYTVDADWYFPTTGPAPTRLIYLQHGFPATASMYDYTAANLAERNHAIVVATSISGNIFDCFGCHLGGDPMHAAVAKLFVGDRAALLASAHAAGFEGSALPDRFVIAGHSGGGQLAAGAAGYFEQFAPDEKDHNLAGVILFDTSPVGGAIERGLAKIPLDIPIYNIAAEPAPLNTYGTTIPVLQAARPNQFVGVQLIGGTHADPLRTHNPFVQFAVELLSGASRPENVEAVQVLAAGWIGDWYEGTHTGYYGDLGSTIDIPTTEGTAHAYVLPAPAPRLTLVDLILKALSESTQVLNFGYCAEDPSASAANRDLTENSTPNTALSLDGRRQTGQSVGQHVCTG